MKDYSLQDDILHIANSIATLKETLNNKAVSFNEQDLDILTKANCQLLSIWDQLSSKSQYKRSEISS